jgi:hypothetical protein
MTEFDKLMRLINNGIKTAESLLRFYNNTKDILDTLKRVSIEDKAEISFTLDDITKTLPLEDHRNIERLLRNYGAKPIFKEGGIYYRLHDILMCLNYITNAYLKVA